MPDTRLGQTVIEVAELTSIPRLCQLRTRLKAAGAGSSTFKQATRARCLASVFCFLFWFALVCSGLLLCMTESVGRDVLDNQFRTTAGRASLAPHIGRSITRRFVV